MGARTIEFTEGEYYHICNHGVEGRNIVIDDFDSNRFELALLEFNVMEPIGSIYEQSFREEHQKEKLVELVCYCLNPNHFHLLLSPKVEGGVEKYLHKLTTGTAKYFNSRYKRKGSLFQGPFRARHIVDNDYLLYASVYVGRNNEVHSLGRAASKLVRRSWEEYIGEAKMGICDKDVVLDQFKNAKEYIMYANDALELMKENKEGDFDLGEKEFFDINLLGRGASK